MEDLRSDAILLTWTVIILETRIQRYNHYILHCLVENVVYHIVQDIIPDVSDYTVCCIQDCVCLVPPYQFRLEPLNEFNGMHDFNITGGGGSLVC